MTQRPDLFGAALPAVGVMDMLRFHRFTIGRPLLDLDDYGSADDPEEFKALLRLLALPQPFCRLAPPVRESRQDGNDGLIPASRGSQPPGVTGCTHARLSRLSRVGRSGAASLSTTARTYSSSPVSR
jgi:hypothetical protein